MYLRLERSLIRYFYLLIRMFPQVFQRKDTRHDLRCTCHRTDHICILPEQYPAAVRIHQHRRSGIKFCRFIPEHPLRILNSALVLCSIRLLLCLFISRLQTLYTACHAHAGDQYHQQYHRYDFMRPSFHISPLRVYSVKKIYARKNKKITPPACLPREMIFPVISCHIFYISNFNCTSSSASSLNDSTCSGFGLGRSSSE